MKRILVPLLLLAVLFAAATPGESERVTAPVDHSSLEVRAFRILNGKAANPVFDAIMPVITNLRRSRVILILVWCALVLFGGTKGRWAAFMLIPLLVASDQISSHLIKPLVERMRPCEVLGGVHLWNGEAWIVTPDVVTKSYKASFSFPSSHAANITASMLFLGLAYRKVLIPLMAVAVLVSYSRIYIGVHWLSDMLYGMALGAALAYPAYLIFGRLVTRQDTGKDPGETQRP
ncbi:MAG: phosphatase PAP2 family protein [bacterium]|nr:MAG: phosphatase PAP2 family protein [bacterium]